MNTNSQINFKEYRTLKDILLDSFKFNRAEFKRFFKFQLIFLVPALLLLGIVIGLYRAELFENTIPNPSEEVFSYNYIEYFLINYGVRFIVYFIAISLSTSVTITYLFMYVNQLNFNNKEFISELKQIIHKVFGLVFIQLLLVSIGFSFFIFPGVYFLSVFSLSTAIMIFEDSGILNSFKRSFYFTNSSLIKTISMLLILTFISSLMILVINLPSLSLSILEYYNVFKISESEYIFHFNIFAGIIFLLSFMVYSFISTTLTLYYFSQYEYKESRKIPKTVNN